VDFARYLDRIGYDGPLDAGHETLAGLQRAHLLGIPFDALDCHLGNPVTVVPEDAYRKVVEHRRGGFCFELNGLFAELMTHLGFDVTRHAARPFTEGGELAPPFAHLALVVQLERRWLVDVGFGFDFAIAPLDLDERGEQRREDQRFRIAPDGDALVAEEVPAPAVRNGYRMELEPVDQGVFAERCRIYSTDPETGFVREGPVMQRFEDGGVRVTRTKVSSSRPGGVSRPIADEDDWRAELASQFGLVVEGTTVRGPSPRA
jgi:N-hydroxyarylamine O-acetyltransferase